MTMLLSFVAIAVVFGGSVILINELLIPRAIIALGNVDSWWSPYQTLPPPGEMYILVRGSKTGPFDQLIESVLDREYDANLHEFSGPLSTLETTPKTEDYLTSLGVAWVGFFRYLFYREVRHDKWEKIPKSTEWGLVSKIRPGPSIYFRYNMAVEIKAAETFGNFPVDGVIVFTAQVINPVKAFFFAGGWEVQTAAAVTGRFRKYVSDKTIKKLRTEHKSKASTLVNEIMSLGGRGSGPGGTNEPNGLYELFGVEIVDARFVLFDLVSGDEEMTRAIRAVEIATLQAKANEKRGKGERWLRQERAAGVRAEVEAWGANPVGGTVAMAEAIKEAKPNVLGAGVFASVDAKRE
ncbi:MAG: hypothetical protein ABIF87_09880 [Pseudomonadota bacterium]